MEFEHKIANTLEAKNVLARHPGQSCIGSDLYSSSVNSISEIQVRQRYTNQYVAAANNLQLGSQSSFFISPGSILGELIITGQLAVVNNTRAADFWGLQLVDSLELILAGTSSIQSLRISGQSMNDIIFSTLDSNKLDLLRKCNAGFIAGGAINVNFSIPIHLFFSSLEAQALFPIDSSTLKSQMIINVTWKEAYKALSGDGTNSVVLPLSFNRLYMRIAQQVGINNDFSMAEMLKDGAVYSIPGLYHQTYSQIVSASPVNEASLVLTSMPSGMLQYMLFSVRKVSEEGSIGTQTLIQPYCGFNSMRILYSGVEIYRFDNRFEGMLTNAAMTNDDNGINVKWRGFLSSALATSLVEYNETVVYVVPIANSVSDIMRKRRTENTRDYSGSSFQVFFTVTPNTPYATNTTPIFSTTSLVNGAEDYRVTVTFANGALYEVTDRSISLEM